MRHLVLTGAPGAGKTALLEAAAASGMATSPEVARALLQQPGGMALRENDPLGFALTMLEGHLAEYRRFADHPGPVLFDRGFPDVVGFLEMANLPIPEAVESACRTLRYDGPIFRAPAWPAIYRQDAERIQDFAEAVASDRAVSAAWRRYGYSVVDLPLASVADRLAFIAARARPVT
ncbi:AAA family ATPase [Porphyrobacter sp. YT40]|uniref:AAA family ATPase n=1 Tax=Porphyrobacter sp. YT40 TaxID=2547601 RepID=UPI001143A5C8|nr:AAA family ATPase [Porphyrobacter sp. YT40]QDH33432.1 ATP-binding protein [Porphyrobacter sp. YT40]